MDEENWGDFLIFITAFVKIEDLDMDKLRGAFLRNIGGQTHVQCGVHKLPLIAPTARENKYSGCGRQDHMRCCEFNCDVFLCNRCFNGKQHNAKTLVFLISEEETDEGQGIESDEDDKEDIDPEYEQTVEFAEENENEYTMDGVSNSLDDADDNVDDFIVSSLEPDLELAEDDDIGHNNY
eukprot:14867516-Ditylum_brightwellii.AAC.1